MKAKSFDKKFDQGKDVAGDLDLSKIRRPNQEQRRVNVDFPTWMIESLDREAGRLGVTRQSIIKVWLAERLEQRGSNKPSQQDTSDSRGSV
ncbi:MAG: CopG family transcriptional regulator [Haliea sp.]